MVVSRLTQLVAKVAWPLKHIAQLLGTHTHMFPHISIHPQYIANEIYVIVCLATRSSSRTSTWTRTTFSGEGLPYYLHIYYIYTHIHFFVFSVCVSVRQRERQSGRELCCNILFIAVAIKCTLGAFVTIFRHTQQWQQVLPIPLVLLPHNPSNIPPCVLPFLVRLKYYNIMLKSHV